MKRNSIVVIFVVIGIAVVGMLLISNLDSDSNFEFAVVSDIHIQDVKGSFDSDEFTGAHINDENFTLRPMYEEMNSTRLFNENYYAFCEVLEELAKREIKQVVLTGDISDDGQKMNIDKVRDLLLKYEEDYNMNFYIVPGNHEPASVNGEDKGDNFLKDDGSVIDVKSNASYECQNDEEGVICDDQMYGLGQKAMAQELADFGYMPEEDYFMWATPYSTYDYNEYTYEQAQKEMDMENRKYESCNEENVCEDVYDLSYVVEPKDGFVFLCLDGVVFVPSSSGGYESTSNNGLNNISENKEVLMTFIQNVSEYAKENDKQLIMFNHYPVGDFYANSTQRLREVFPEDALYFERLPKEEVVKWLASNGINLAFSGHMHYNDTAVYDDGENYLVDVMAGSTAAYAPSYKVVSYKGNNVYDIETDVIKEVKDFDKLFDLYKIEYDYEQTLSDKQKEELGIIPWDESILSVDNYYDFTINHLKTLTINRHYEEWPEELKAVIDNLNLYEIVIYSQINQKMTPEEFSIDFNTNSNIQKAKDSFDKYLTDNLIDFKIIQDITGEDILITFYEFLSADELAYEDMIDDEINGYSFAFSYMKNKGVSKTNAKYVHPIVVIFETIYDFGNDYPSDDFEIDLENKSITNLNEKENRIQIIK